MCMAAASRRLMALVALTTATASSFDSRASDIPSRPRAASGKMAPLAAGRGSGTSSWPAMQRPPADNDDVDDNNDRGEAERKNAPAIMNYASPESAEMSTRRDLAGSDAALEGVVWNPTLVEVGNARLLRGEGRMTLDGNGFELRVGSEEEAEALRGVRFVDQDRVVEEYYPACERLVSDALASQASARDASGSSPPPVACVRAFDHNVRSSDAASVGEITSKEATGATVQNPAGLVHADYTLVSAPRRLRDLSNPPKMNDVLRPKLLAEGRASLLDPATVKEALDGKRRYAFVNVWRSVDPDEPVGNPPLACVDAATAAVDDLRTFRIHYTDRVGENYFACPPPSSGGRRHAWRYFPGMTMREALLLKQWDSEGGVARGARRDGAEEGDSDGFRPDGGGGISTFTIHSAFIDPSVSPKSPPRKSIEVRCVAIWEKEG